jgi:ubiquinol-cytochrome c reductase cytochrome b/c1 subunit
VIIKVNKQNPQIYSYTAGRPATVVVNHLLFYPTPANLSYNWSFGSLAGLFFALQLVTGILLAMHYTGHVDLSFSAVEHVMSDVNNGYTYRYFHANGASTIFILIYLHIGRGLYYQSYLVRPGLWSTGLVILLLMMATGFIGYVLPWGQMSFWGATVITSLVTAVPFVGEDIAYWILTRFFSAHYLLPFLVLGIILTHLVLLHTTGSTNPLTTPVAPAQVPFHNKFSYKDAVAFLGAAVFFGILGFYLPNMLGHSDNFIPANPLVTPAHIVPEWYFTPFYAILRACPNKLGGALGMFAAIAILFLLPFMGNATATQVVTINRPHRLAFWCFAAVFGALLFLGSRPAEVPFVQLSKVFTIVYFMYFGVVLPVLTGSRTTPGTRAARFN